MSQETSLWLNTKTLIGFTDKRGKAWSYRAEDQGARSNHYPGAIPIGDVRERLFNWEAVEGDVTSTLLLPDGVATLKDPKRKSICRPPGAFGLEDQGAILGLFKDGYVIHQYDEWLLQYVSHLLDDDLQIGSAGLLKDGALAWVQIEVPETITTPEGVAFRPFLHAGTSLDGSLSSTYGTGNQLVVCDNTFSAALSDSRDAGTQIKVKHSRYSKLKLAEARDALNIVHQVGEDFAQAVAELTSIKVSEGDWSKFLDVIASVKDEKGEEKKGRSLTLAENKRDVLDRLWRHDNRVAPWTGTAFGVVQAANTLRHHEGIVRGADRAERNALNAITGITAKADEDVARTIKQIVGVA